MPWLHLKVQAHRSIRKTLIRITLVRGADLSTEGGLTICFPIWCDEWSVICKLFYIKSALLISVCWPENLVLSGSSCSGGELLLFHQLMDISSLFLLQMHCQLLSEMGNVPWSRRSYEANKILVPVLDIKQTSCACCSLTWSSPLWATWHLSRKCLHLFRLWARKIINTVSKVVNNEKWLL